MILGTIVPAGERIVLNTADGATYIGKFLSHTMPYIAFRWEDNDQTIYVNTEHIVSVYVLEETIGDPGPPNQGEVSNILGRHSSKTRSST